MARVTELIFKGTDRGVVRTLSTIERQSKRTNTQLKRDAAGATGSFAAMEKGANKTRGALGSLAGIAGFGGLAYGMKDVVQGGLGLQARLAQLDGALKATGQYSGSAAEELKGMAESLSTRGGFSTQENIQALTNFVSATRDAGKAQRDLSLATDIARRSGKPFQTVVRALMMLENGRTTGLARLGLAVPKVTTAEDVLTQARLHQKDSYLSLIAAGYKFTTAQKAQYALTHQLTPAMINQAKAQDKLGSTQAAFTELQQRYGGATQAYANTTQGKVEAMRQSFKNLVDNLGMALLPTVQRVAGWFTKLAGFFAKHRTLTKDLLIATTLLVGAYAGFRIIQGISAMFTALGGVFTALTAEEGLLAGASGLLGAAMNTIPILALITGAVLLITHWKQVKHVFMEVWDWLKQNWPKVAPFLLGPVVGATALIIQLFHRQILGAIKDVWNWIKGAASWLWDALTWPYRKAWSVVSFVFRKIKGAVSSAWNWIKGAASDVWNALTWPFRKAWQFISGVFNKIKGAAHDVIHFGGIANPINWFASGGIVKPKYLAVGGPSGTDTVPAWLTPGEGVVNTTGMRILGSEGLANLNAGRAAGGDGGGQGYLPVTVQLRLDSRVITQQVVNVVLRKAARGPGSYSGGSLVTGGPTPVMPGT